MRLTCGLSEAHFLGTVVIRELRLSSVKMAHNSLRSQLLGRGGMPFFTLLRARLRYCTTLLLGRRVVRLANTTPMISFTFDDFPRSALHSGGTILEEFGLAATYYAALGLMNAEAPVGRIFSEEDLSEVLARGHELGCHTFDHCHAWKTHPTAFEQSILKNRWALRQLLPGPASRPIPILWTFRDRE